MGVDVDEAGRDELAGDVDDSGSRRRRQVADGGDAIAGDADVGTPRRAAAAVEHLTATEQDVKAGLRG